MTSNPNVLQHHERRAIACLKAGVESVRWPRDRTEPADVVRACVAALDALAQHHETAA